MPIPEKHKQQLDVELHNHEKELKELEAITNSHPEVRTRIEIHRAILGVGRDSKIRKLVDELHDKPDLVGQLARDPPAFIEARGIRLPSGATKIIVLSQAPQPVAFGMEFRVGHAEFRLEWNSEHGFLVHNLSGGAQRPPTSH